MSIVEKAQESLVTLNAFGINGGDSAGAQNGVHVSKVDPLEAPNTSTSSETAHVEDPRTGDFRNKQDENQTSKNGAQGRCVKIDKPTTTSLIELPAAAPITVIGRPTVLTPELLDQLCNMVALGFSRAQAAGYLGVSRSAITRAVQKYPELAAALQRAEEVSDLQPQMTVMAEARKNWRAAAWLLEFKARYHRRTVTEEDKEAAHQENLEEIRRSNERLQLLLSSEGLQREPEPEQASKRGKRK